MTLSRNNELGLYTPRSLRSAGLRPWGSLPRLVAALSSALVRTLEDSKIRLGAGRGLLLWISLSVALLSGSGFELKPNFYLCARGEPFLVLAISCLLDLVLSGTHVHHLSLTSSSRAGRCEARAHQARANTATGAHLSWGPFRRGDELRKVLRNLTCCSPARSWR